MRKDALLGKCIMQGEAIVFNIFWNPVSHLGLGPLSTQHDSQQTGSKTSYLVLGDLKGSGGDLFTTKIPFKWWDPPWPLICP